jgi:Dyp-type peroxidase family
MIDFADLQGGIVRSYGRHFPIARHLFARVREPAGARRLLAGLADSGRVTSAHDWGADRPATTLNLALSFRALEALGLSARLLDGFPSEFRRGMAHRADRLADDPRTWEDDLRDLEVLLVVHAQSEPALTDAVDRLRDELAGAQSGLELTHVEEAALLGDDAREHFGFTDGFSQPAIEGVVARAAVPGQGILEKRVGWLPWSPTRWRAIKPGEFVLGYEDEDRGLAPAPAAPFHRNATYMVWRKLHQDVAGFRAQLAGEAQRLGMKAELLGAKLIGRWPDGSPLALRPDGPDPKLGNDKKRANDFLYGDDPDGLRCPRGAHVRRSNPRDALGWEGRLSARHRILRRGMPYGSPLPQGAEDDGAARGLLFICMQASIARQFEIVQSQWLNDGNAFGLGAEPDPISGPPGRESRYVIEGDPVRVASGLRTCVECRGGEYLFVPSVTALKALPAL